jgi:hypothetical protein
MNPKVLQQTIKDATRFLERARHLKTQQPNPTFDRYEGGVDTAALKRASMDLTRSLTQLRKPN